MLNGDSKVPNTGCEIKTGLLNFLSVIVKIRNDPKIRPKTKKPFFFIKKI
jgi:hypothetical protein